MKKNYWLFIVLATLFTSCKKDNTEPEEPSPLIAVITTFGNNTNQASTQTFTYDDQQRVKEITEGSGTNTSLRKKYVYTNNKVELRAYDNNGNEQSIYTTDYYLNNAGLVEDQINSNGFRSVYEYNEQSFLKKIAVFRNGLSEGYFMYHYNGNNILDSLSGYTPANEKFSISIFLYDQGKKNSIGNTNKGMKMFGRDQRLALLKETRYAKNIPGGNGSLQKFFEDEYSHSYVNGERIINTIINRTMYSYPGPVTSNFIQGRYGYSYK